MPSYSQDLNKKRNFLNHSGLSKILGELIGDIKVI